MKKEERKNKSSQYEIKTKRKSNNGNSKKDKKSGKNGKKIAKKIFLTIVILMVLIILAGIGVFAAIFFSDKWSITKQDLIAHGNSEVFDSNGEKIAVVSPSEGYGNRKIITIDQMGRFTPNAYVAIEDKRFYEHSGVDLLRTAKATASYIINKGSSDVGGGSTITQQLVKNLMKDKANTGSAGIERKIREMSRAYQIEKMLTKDQILEKYLNIIFVAGKDLQGVEYGARYYFAKSAKDLDLAESAFLAGINNGPNMYDPYDEQNDHTELIKNRTKLVLNAMKDQNRISDDQQEAEQLYNEAIEKVNKGFEFKKGEFDIGNMTYFVSETLSEVANDFAEEKDIDYSEAMSIIKSGGYKIYSTQDTKIQNTILNEMSKSTYRDSRTEKQKDGSKITDHTEAAMVVIDFTNGNVVGMGGALNSDVGTNLNYAKTHSKQTGSALKPLVNIAPGLEEKVITASTVYADLQTDFKLGYYPSNAYRYGAYGDTLTARRATEVSSNIVNMKILSNIGVNTAIKYLHQFGLETYNKEDDGGLTLAIGGVAHSSSPLEMAAAYAALANKGEYIEPTFYSKVVDNEGKTILEPKQEKRRVISEANAFIVSDILTGVTTQKGGTANYCAISGMDVAAKTGTTDHITNKWLCGYTPYYTAATWYGFSDQAGWRISGNKQESAKHIWGNVMKEIHKDLEGKRFEKPSGVVTAKVCKNSGKLATKQCSNTYTEYFAKGSVPKPCDGHVKVKICKESGKVATPYCKDVEEKIYTDKPEKEANGWWKTVGGDRYKVPKEKCSIHTEETSKITVAGVVGKKQAEATKLLEGLNVKIEIVQDASKGDGIVIKQSLEKDTKVDKGVTITLTVNKKPEASKPPKVENTEKPSSAENTTKKPSENTKQEPTNTEPTNTETKE